MNFYPEDYIVNVTVPFTDKNGAAVTPSAVTAALYDDDDVLVVDFGSVVFVPADGDVTITIPALYNSLGAGEIRVARILRVDLVTASGVITKIHSYVVEAEQRLAVMTNTFQSLEAAEILAIDIPNAAGWAAADEDQKRAALVEAFKRLTSIPMRCVPRDPVTGDPLPAEEWYVSREDWLETDSAAFAAFPSHFKRALKRAQFLEAAEILTNEVIGRKRRQGIISETIGESSVRFQGGKIDYGISTQAMAALAGYIHFNMRIARA